MTETLVITAVGPDRPGLVQSLAASISKHEGNWCESRMAQLAGRFAGIIMVTVPSDRADALQKDLEESLSGSLRVVVQRSETVESVANPVRRARVELIGSDHTGIVREIAQALSQLDVNVEELVTHTVSAPMSGNAMFSAELDLSVPADLDLVTLRLDLERLADDLMVDIKLSE
ncbi:MAG: hypothetical protein KC561_18750 [Myxococcales bacterium]|nr:hypothetical protein [Myxococcales bacterium]